MNEELPEVQVDEIAILSKFDGDSTDPADEVERITIQNGTVVSHDVIADGEIVGPVEDDNKVGADVGRLLS